MKIKNNHIAFLFAFFLIFICFQNVFAQNSSIKIKELIEKAQKLSEEEKFKESIVYSEEAFLLCQNDQKEYEETLSLLGYAHYRTGNSLAALRYGFQLLKYYKKFNKLEEIADLEKNIGIYYAEGGLHEKALEYFLHSDSIQSNLKQDHSDLNELIANSYQKLKRYEDALVYYEFNLDKYKKDKHSPKIIHYLQKIAECEAKLGKYQQVLEDDLEILKISKEKSDSEQIISALNNVGYDYKYLKNYSEAIKYFNEAFALQQKSDGKNVASQISMLTNLAVVYQNKGDYPEAIKNMNEAKTLVEKRGNQSEMAKINDLLAVIYYNHQDYYNASLFNEKSIELAKKVADKSILQTSYKTSAQIYQALDDFQQALEYYKLHLALKDSLSLEHRLKQQELLQQQFLVERTEKELNSKIAEEEVKDLEAKRMILEREKQAQEFALLKKQQELTGAKLAQEELERQRIEQALLIAETQLETDKKGKEIIELQRLQAVKDLELKKQELADQQQKQQIETLEQNDKLQDLQIKEQEATRNFLYGMIALGSFIIFLIILGLIYNRRKNQLLEAKNSEIQKQKDDIERKSFELEQQTAEIEAQRDALSGTNYKLNKAYEDIKSSIHYAQRIQKAMLPQDSQIKKVLPESFLFFKPRDVVSGDFYWLGEVQEKVVIVAADCTGHGVPGAFMSLIGNDLLNEIVLAREIIEADQILNELHKGVRRALKQNETSNKDGMDLALCVINKKENEVVYAGAKNPMIFIQNNELDTIKADKMPIGGSSQEHQIGFSKKHIPLKEENTFYIFSDGYQDQFGGEKDQKFMIKNMRELLFEIHKKSMDEQRIILDTTMTNWIKSGKGKQIDDILVIGFRL